MTQLGINETFQMAQKLHQQGDSAKAAQLYEAVLKVDPMHAEANHYLGLLMLGRDINHAISLMRKAISIDSTNPIFHNNLGEVYRQTGQLEHAEFHLSAACELKSDYSEAFSNLGLVYKEKGQIVDSKYCFAEALHANPNNLNALINTGNLFFSEKEYEDALQCYDAALQLSPDNTNALASAAAAAYELCDYNTAAKHYSRLINGNPNLHNDKVNLALITLRNKDFRKGLQLYEARFNCLNTMEGDRETLWRGVNLKGKTLYVYNETEGLSGFGDTIMFSRYLLELEKYEADKVVFRVQPELLGLISANMPEYIEVTDRACEQYDTHSPLLSLPFVLNARAKTIPSIDGYLKADETKTAEFAEAVSTSKLKVGLCFQTNRNHIKHEERSIPQDSLAPLYQNDKIQLFYVSKEETDVPLNPSIKDMRDKIQNFSDTAAIIKNMDLLITADTSVAHLAGALGKKTLLLLNDKHDWRWFSAKTGKVCEWYSNVTFHVRQPNESWLDVVSSIKL